MAREIAVPDLPDAVRVQNVMGMFERGELHTPGQPMRVLPLMCQALANMRKHYTEMVELLRWRRYDEEQPSEGDKVILQCPDDNEQTTLEAFLWAECDAEFFNGLDEESRQNVYWLPLPPL